MCVLADDRVGHANQALGVADALAMPYSVLPLRYNRLARLPNLVLGATDRHLATDACPSPPWPDLLIAAGRRTAPVARAIKARSGGRTHLVQCMWPGFAAADFDLIAVPEHDRRPPHPNVVSTVGALHRVTAARLAAAAIEWGPVLEGLARPRIAVLVGGATRRRDFGNANVDTLASQVRQLAETLGASVKMATSPRTGRELADRLDAVLQPDHIYRWSEQSDKNPYLGYLALADIIVVTGDSMAMCSEACVAGRPVYIHAPQHRTTAKHARLHRALYGRGVARPLSGTHEKEWCPEPFDEAGRVARAIRERVLT